MHRHRARSAALVSGIAGLLATTAIATPRLACAQPPAPTAQAPPAPAPAAPAPTAPAAPGAPVATAPAPAPAPPPVVAQTGVVQRILVRGNERIEPATVISYLPISVGQTIDAAQQDAALKALFRTDLFSDVKMQLNNSHLVLTLAD